VLAFEIGMRAVEYHEATLGNVALDSALDEALVWERLAALEGTCRHPFLDA
jgi:hypothetical protein